MVDHDTCWSRPRDLVAVNGHRPRVLGNITRKQNTLQCSCGWISPRPRAWRWAHLIDRDWAAHAGDIALGQQIVHGEPGMGCGCYRCDLADRAATGDRTAAQCLDSIRQRHEGGS